MKAESNIMPVSQFEIEFNGEMCDVRFFENIEEIMNEEGGEKYIYDEYVLRVRNRIGIETDIEDNLSVWMQLAKDTEYDTLVRNIRMERNRLLEVTDKYVLPDYPITDTQREEVLDYRQKLRDITKQEKCPYCIEFPKLPNQ